MSGISVPDYWLSNRDGNPPERLIREIFRGEKRELEGISIDNKTLSAPFTMDGLHGETTILKLAASLRDPDLVKELLKHEGTEPVDILATMMFPLLYSSLEEVKIDCGLHTKFLDIKILECGSCIYIPVSTWYYQTHERKSLHRNVLPYELLEEAGYRITLCETNEEQDTRALIDEEIHVTYSVDSKSYSLAELMSQWKKNQRWDPVKKKDKNAQQWHSQHSNLSHRICVKSGTIREVLEIVYNMFQAAEPRGATNLVFTGLERTTDGYKTQVLPSEEVECLNQGRHLDVFRELLERIKWPESDLLPHTESTAALIYLLCDHLWPPRYLVHIMCDITLDAFRSKHGEGSIFTLGVLTSFAEFYRARGAKPAARKLIESALPVMESLSRPTTEADRAKFDDLAYRFNDLRARLDLGHELHSRLKRMRIC